MPHPESLVTAVHVLTIALIGVRIAVIAGAGAIAIRAYRRDRELFSWGFLVPAGIAVLLLGHLLDDSLRHLGTSVFNLALIVVLFFISGVISSLRARMQKELTLDDICSGVVQLLIGTSLLAGYALDGFVRSHLPESVNRAVQPLVGSDLALFGVLMVLSGMWVYSGKRLLRRSSGF